MDSIWLMRFVYGGGATHSRAREVKRVRRISLNRIRSQGGFYLVNGIRLRGRCDALAHSIPSIQEQVMPQYLLGLFGRDVVHHKIFVGFGGGEMLIDKIPVHQRSVSHADEFLVI